MLCGGRLSGLEAEGPHNSMYHLGTLAEKLYGFIYGLDLIFMEGKGHFLYVPELGLLCLNCTAEKVVDELKRKPQIVIHIQDDILIRHSKGAVKVALCSCDEQSHILRQRLVLLLVSFRKSV